MNISAVTTSNSHSKSILLTLQSREGLPLHDVLSSEAISDSFQAINYSERDDFYPPDVTLWSQV